MLILRILGLLNVLTIGVSLMSWAFTRDARYVQFAWRVAKAALVIALAVMALLAAERLIVL